MATKNSEKKSQGSTASKVLVRQVRSIVGRSKDFRLTMSSIGLGRIGDEQVLVSNPAIRGALSKVRHVITVSEVK